ncbi:hypothetical protein BCT90_13040 [Vibrio lentus]|uniref:Uncharacterized protein n=1 Tax=Vibrio lentus TaxID=136468 RepID=A0A2N7BHT9_9VIBR|nr:hypothetical protein BCV34_13855 [Vibrio lentus]PME55318.1 hypothetical protein BCV30_20785 [Vibrio lentus]PME77335.1 hypothetical protein BCV27_19240 [Vibrio lentus]PMG65793.1 hypothetical protein BCU86_14915 [Vibrio lentus]PMH93523.1 hypothetical protein BCU56_22225 [Vibrio lentus]
MDAVHPTQATKLSCGWIRKGQGKFIETTGSRTRVNLNGALPLKNISATITDAYETIDSESIVCFFWKLKKEHYPLERLWKIMNEHVRYNVYFLSKTSFTSAIKKFFDVTLPEIGRLPSRYYA